MPTKRILALTTAAAAAAVGASLAAGMAAGPRGQLSSAETTQGPNQRTSNTQNSQDPASQGANPEDPSGGNAPVGADTSGPKDGGIELPDATDPSSGTGGDTGSGHLPGLAQAGGSGDRLPAALPPAAAYQEGGLVTGYPGRVIPAIPGTTGLSTSVAPSGHRFQAALVGRVNGDPASVLRFYQTRLTKLGFTAEERPAVAGSTALGFTRSDGSVVVTATPGHPTSYSVFAVLTVGGT